MSDVRQPTQLIARMGRKSDKYIASGSDWVNYAKAIEALNEEQTELCDWLIDQDKGLFLKSSLVSLVANQQEYSLPADCRRIKRLEIYNNGSSSLWTGHEVEIVPFIDREMFVRTAYRSVNWYSSKAALRNRKIHALPNPSSSVTNAWRLWYFAQPPEMLIATASEGGASTITLPETATAGTVSAVDDAYNEAWVYISSGTGSGQLRQCSDYVGDTRVLTVSESWSTQPDATSVIEVLAALPREDMEVLALGALRRIESSDADRDGWERNHRADYEMAKLRLLEIESAPQVQNPPRMNIVCE